MTEGRFRALIAASLALPVLMTLLGPSDCGGVWRLCSFDAQMLPYRPEAARAYLAAIRPDVQRYLWIVQPLDLILPITVCMALREGFSRWAPARFLRLLHGAAVLYLIVDYVENAAVRIMLTHPAGDFPNWIAQGASGLTAFKWALLIPLLLAAALAWHSHRRFDRGGTPR